MSAATQLDADVEATWWEESDPKRAGDKALALAQAIELAQGGRRNRNLRHAKLYSNQDLASIYDMGVATSVYAGGVYLSVNVTESCVNTLTAKCTRTRIRPTVLTEKGSRSLRRKAEAMTQILDGVFYASELHEGEGEQVFVDGALFGTGWFYTDEGAPGDPSPVMVERVLPDEILIDDTEAIYARRSLKTIIRKRYIHEDVLMRMPAKGKGKERLGDSRETRAAIRAASVERIPGQRFAPEASKMVPVYFAWRLPSAPGAGDGRHLMFIQGATLRAREWKRSRLPFDPFIFQRRPTGIWGRSLAEQLVPVQLKINELIEVIDDGQEAAAPRTFYQTGAVNPDDFDNELGRLIETTLPPAQAVYFHPGLGASEEMYKDLETWIRRAYEITGISMLSASAEKPEGISSAVALRELLDREDLRFAPLGKRWERANRDVAWNVIETFEEVAESRPVLVQVPGDKFVKMIDWKDAKLERQRLTVTVGAASALPTTPAARKQYAQDLLQLGVITKERFAEIVDESGDVKAITSLVTAAQTAIEMDIEAMVEQGKPMMPDPLLDPALARNLAIQEYAKCRHEDVPEERMEMLRRYILMATKYSGPQTAQGQPAQQAAAAEQAQAGAGGEPAPGEGPDAALGMNNAQDLQAAAPQPAPPVAPAQ